MIYSEYKEEDCCITEDLGVSLRKDYYKQD